MNSANLRKNAKRLEKEKRRRYYCTHEEHDPTTEAYYLDASSTDLRVFV
jgi:hypothetical protein